MIRRTVLTVVLAVVATLAAGCGVGSDDEPRPIEETSIPPPVATPSVATEPGPSPMTTTPTTTSPTPTSSTSPGMSSPGAG